MLIFFSLPNTDRLIYINVNKVQKLSVLTSRKNRYLYMALQKYILHWPSLVTSYKHQ